MYENIIKSYINRLSINDIFYFTKKNNISITDNEANIIYNFIKKYWKTLIFGDPSNVFLEYKKLVSENTYNTTIKLYNYYKNKIPF